ncbi:MAG: pilus assembly protein N-terminal domain-containing protein [Oligoflexia bacterium]|nr:pilus assembly protein N-terminal domain-containing protein [Oligoflexia bacterium]
MMHSQAYLAFLLIVLLGVAAPRAGLRADPSPTPDAPASGSDAASAKPADRPNNENPETGDSTAGSFDAPTDVENEEAAELGTTGKKTKPNYRRSRLTTDESEGRADHRRMVLTTGEDKTVDLDFDVNTTANGISVGNPLIVATTLVKVGDRRQIVFKPLKAGETTVTVRDADGNIRLIFSTRVTGSNLLRIAGEIRDLLRDVEGITIRIVGPKVVIDGEVIVPQDYGRIFVILNDPAYKDFVMNFSQLSPLGIQIVAKKIQDDVRAFAPNVSARVVNGVVFVEGQVETKDLADKVMAVASTYLPEVKPANLLDRDLTAQRSSIPRSMIKNMLLIMPPQQKKEEKLVRITAHFVELDKDYAKLFAFAWAPGFTAGSDQINIGSGASNGASFSATLSSLFPQLQSAQQAGYARVLRTGTVVVRSGQPAALSEDTQIPYVVQGTNGQVTPASSQIGLKIDATPQIIGQSDDISLDLDVNQISLVSGGTGGQAAVTTNHRVKTKIYIKSGESAAVASVNSSDVGTDFNKDNPNAGSYGNSGEASSQSSNTSGTTSASSGSTTTPLFSLLHSKNYRKKKSQFVIFITPQIVENASQGTEDLKKNFRVKVQ